MDTDFFGMRVIVDPTMSDNQIDLVDMHQQGVLCNQGYMREIYDKKTNDLIRRFTPAGIARVREVLVDPVYRKKFFAMLAHEINHLPVDTRRGILFELDLRLR